MKPSIIGSLRDNEEVRELAKCGNCQTDVEKSGRYWTVCNKCGFRECNHCSPRNTKCKRCREGFMH